MLAELLDDAGPLPANFAKQGDRIEAGHIYVAPPDHHLLVNNSHTELTRGPKENWARPAIDPLFRTAAEAYRGDAIGLVLTGNLNDGTLGLYEIKRRGGVSIVQDPEEAEAPSMPRSALMNVPIDYKKKLGDIPGLLVQLASQPSEEANVKATDMSETLGFDQPVAQTCPECGGAMRKRTVGNIVSYHCHIGHSMTGQVLSSIQAERIEDGISAVLRTLNERVDLCRTMERQAEQAGRTDEAASWSAAAQEAGDHARQLDELLRVRWTHPEDARKAS